MNAKRRTALLLVSLVGALAIIACALGGGASPTATSPAPVATKATSPTKPPASQATPTEASPPVAAGDIKMDSVNGFKDNFDTWHVVGMVTNQTDHPVNNIGIDVEIFDANQKSLYKDSTGTNLYTLAPGETSPFSLSIYEDIPDADNFVATVTGSDTTDLNRAALDVTHTTMTVDDDGDVHVTGELVNNTGGPVNINSVASATFTSGGDLITADSDTVTIGYLEDEESGPFRVTMTGPASGLDDLKDFKVYVDSESADSAESFSIAITDDHYDYLDSFGNLHVVGELTNNSDKNLNIRLVAAVYDSDGNVIDAASLDAAFSSIKPGESVPYDLNSWGPIDYTDGMYSDKADSLSVQWDPYWTWTTDTELVDLTTSGDDNSFDDTEGTFTGQIVNNSGEIMGSAVILIYFTDKTTKQVIGMGYSGVYDELAAGASAEYTVYIPTAEDFDVSNAEFIILVKGQRP